MRAPFDIEDDVYLTLHKTPLTTRDVILCAEVGRHAEVNL